MSVDPALISFGNEVDRIIAERANALGAQQDWVLPQLSTEDVALLFAKSRMDWSAVDLTGEKRMERGIAYLRRFYPLAPQFVDCGKLDIIDCGACVLGQIWGGFPSSLEVRLLGRAFLRAHAFWPMGEGGPALALDGASLTASWREWLEDAPLGRSL